MDTQQKGFPTPNLPKEDVIDTMETCCLCGTKLRFSHQTDYLNLQVMEQTQCPACGIKNRTGNYVLQ